MRLTFWQKNLSPHSVPIAAALGRRGHAVRIVVHKGLAPERQRLGWRAGDGSSIDVVNAAGHMDEPELKSLIDGGDFHFLQGLPRAGFLRRVHLALFHEGALFGSVMEQVDDRGLKGVLKRLEYRVRLRNREAPRFVLAIGERAVGWFAQRSRASMPIIPFAYFLEGAEEAAAVLRDSDEKFRLGFVGQMIRRKRVDLLIEALAHSSSRRNCRLECVGTGVEESTLQTMAHEFLGPGAAEFRGAQPFDEVKRTIDSLDCLVLPSDFDGWGAVVSEALIRGVPVIASDACGAIAALIHSNAGQVFQAGNASSLSAAIDRQVAKGKPTEAQRQELRRWASCLTADAGATYLESILSSLSASAQHFPPPPWQTNTADRARFP